MSPPAAYSEERIVEQPAIALFAEMGWRTASAMEEKFGGGGTLGWEMAFPLRQGDVRREMRLALRAPLRVVLAHALLGTVSAIDGVRKSGTHDPANLGPRP
jgi:hypothetical protein